MSHQHRLDYLFILLIVLAGSLALFFKIGNVPPSYPWSDESEIAADAVGTLKEGPRLFYPDQLAGGSLAVWLEAGWMAIFGRDLVGLRVLNGLVNLISAVLLYLLVCQLPLNVESNIQRLTALTSALLLAVSTWLLGLGRIAAPNWSLVPLMTNLTFYLFWRGLHTTRRAYFIATGAVLGLLFYGYLPGYFAPFVVILFIGLRWGLSHTSTGRLTSTQTQEKHQTESRSLTTDYGLLFLSMLLVAAPMLIFFGLNPDAGLQRPLQLADTNELAATGSMAQGLVDMLSTFGLYPNWLLQGKVVYLAFDPLVTVLFVAGLLLALWRWRQPAYLFVLSWWGMMIIPALLSRSASQGFIFEVWRRGIGAQPVSFILPALVITHLGLFLKSLIPSLPASRPVYLVALGAVLISAGLSYQLYFQNWANSETVSTLFAPGPVRLVQWLKAEGQADTLFIFPLRPNVSPTTRPELFTVRYLYGGPARLAFPLMDESTIDLDLTQALAGQPALVKLMRHNRIPVDPKGYFKYALDVRGEIIDSEQVPDYEVVTYHLTYNQAGFNPSASFTPLDVAFSQSLRLTGQKIQPASLVAGQTIGVALRWLKPITEEIDFSTSLVLSDDQGYDWVKADKPLLSPGDYRTSSHWPAGTESTLYYALLIPADAPPGPYTLRLVAYRADTGEQLAPAGYTADLSLPLAQVNILPRSTPVDALALNIPRLLNVEFANGLKLVGTTSSAAPVSHPGDQIWITLWWQAGRALSKDIGLMLALAVHDGGQPTPLFDQPQPLLATYPSGQWPAGQTYRANYRALLPASLTTRDFLLALRLFDLATREPLAEQGLFPLSVEARPHVFDAPALPNPVNLDFGDVLRLRGFAATGDSELHLKLQWQALREMRESYKIFLHLTNAAGQIVAQVDTLPQQGAAPTTSWLPGEIIEDQLTLTLPPNLPPGAYRLVVGWYNTETGQRLPVSHNDYAVLIERVIQ